MLMLNNNSITTGNPAAIINVYSTRSSLSDSEGHMNGFDYVADKAQFQKSLSKHNNDVENLYWANRINTKESLKADREDQDISHCAIENLPPPSVLENLANFISLDLLNIKETQPNKLLPREQEKENENIKKAVYYIFNNKFMKAKRIYESNASDPMYALGLGSMMFLKSLMTLDTEVMKETIDILTSVYHISTAQINKATHKHVGDTVLNYFSTCRQYLRLSKAIPTYIDPVKPKELKSDTTRFLPNGVLRAHIARGEACLQIAILYLLQETSSNYTKCGLNLRRAYVNYNVVWQEYKRLGQYYDGYIDRDTISGMQLGIGSIHLILSLLPPIVLQQISAFEWKPDRHLGFVLLELCIESRQMCSPLASLMLTVYYTVSITLCPNVLSTEYIQPAIKTLLDSQALYPNSAIFLYFAGRLAREANNMLLSSQSFEYFIQASEGDWTEADMRSAGRYELAVNHMMAQRWEQAYVIFLDPPNPWFLYLSAACLSMMGNDAEAILMYAKIANEELPEYVCQKVRLLQRTGYQEIGIWLNALEYLYLYHHLTGSEHLESIEEALYRIVENERIEYQIRTQELVPETSPPDYDRPRGCLLLFKVSILNNMGRCRECIVHLNWIMDHSAKMDTWVTAYAYWEAGNTCWNLEQKEQAVSFWEKALQYKGYVFRSRLVMRVHLALKYAKEQGVDAIKLKEQFRLNSSIICDLAYDGDCKTESSDEGNGSIASIEVDKLDIEINEATKY